MTTEPTSNPTTTTRPLTERILSALPTRSVRRHSMAWMAALVAVLAIAAVGSGAMPQGSRDARVKAKRSNGTPAGKAAGVSDGTGPILAQTEFELTGQQIVVGPATQPVPKNVATAINTTVEGVAQGGLDPDYRIRGWLAGPSFQSPRELECVPGQQLAIPAMASSGHHDVSGLRVVNRVTGATIDSIPVVIEGSTPENPIAVCSIDVLDQILVTEVDVHEMTYEEIVQAGISIDDDSYTYYNFALALGTTSNGVQLNIPVAIPPAGGPDPSPIAPTVVNVGDAVDERPIYLVPVFLEVENEDEGEELEFQGRPIKIPGVIIIPGQVGILNQHFEATLVVANGAPAGSPISLAVRDLTAMIELPDAGTPNDASDDPLKVAETQEGGQVTTLPIHGLGPDGDYGTADDSTVLRPGEAGQASFLVEGLKEGLHTIDFNLEGTLDGLPIGPVTVKTRVPGSVLVRDRRFAITFTHPDVVRDGQDYDFGVTLTNTSENVAIQQAVVTLSPAMISGARLVALEDPAKQLTAIPPGGSKTVIWRLKSTTTGRVTASYGKVGGEIEAGLSLVMGVGDRNVPLSPDSLILPDAVKYLPSPFVEASRALLGQAWSVANAPPALIPEGVKRVSAQAVADRAGELGMAGIRTEFGEPLIVSLGTLARDWIGEQQETPDEGFADVLRETVAGDAWFDALGVQLFQRLTVGSPAISPADLHREIAESEMSRSPMVSALVSQTPGTAALAGGRLIDSQGRITGFLATPGERAGQNPLAGAARLSNGDVAAGAGATAGQFMFASRVDNMPWTFELSGWSTGSVDVSLVVPATERAANRVVFSGIPVTSGSRHRVVARPFGGTTFTLEVWQGSAWQPSGIAASVTRFEDPAPRLLGVQQLSPDLIKGGDKYGRLIGLMFSKPMSPLQAEVASRYTIGGGELVETGELVGGPVGVSSAKLNFGGRLAVVALKSPIGPYIHRTVTTAGLVDTRGVPVVGGAAADIHARVSPEGIPPGGWVTGRVLKATGEAVAGADVLYWTRTCNDDEFDANDAPSFAGYISSAPKLITVVKSDSSGRYSIDYVRNSTCGAVQIEAYAPDGNGRKKRTTPVNYDGQHLGVDLVFLARGSVQGTVFRHDNTPAPYARVSIIPTLDVTGTRTVQADAAGHFRADEVPVGTFSVKSVGSGPDYLASGLAAGALEQPNGVATVNVTLQNTSGRVSGTVRYAANPDRSDSLFVLAYATIPGFGEHLVGFDVVNPDHTFEIGGLPIGSVRVEVSNDWRAFLGQQTVVLTEANPSFTGMTFLLATLGAIEGRVIDDQGYALGNAVVRSQYAEVRTNAFGEYRIPDVHPGNHQLTATQIGTELSGSIEVTVQDGATVTGATIVIATPSTISGRVFLQRNGATIPVSGAYVTVDGRNLAVTDSQGRYTLRNVIGNSAYRLRAVHPNGLIALNQNIVVGHAETITRDVTFRPGRLHGTVLEPNGTPHVADIAVGVMRPELTPGSGFGMLTPVEVTPVIGPSTGAYSVEDVNPGAYNVRASNIFFNEGRQVIKGGTIEFGEDETCDLTLVATFTGSVHGRITKPDGTPAGADIDVTIGGGALANVTVRTIADGTYAFPEVFSAGNYTITALDRTTAETKQGRVAVRMAEDAEVNLKLLGRGGIRVHVVDGAGVPVTGGSVTIDGTEHPRNHGYSVIPPGGGTLEFPGISEGPYAVSATWNGLSGRVSAFVANGTTVDVTVQLQSSGTVTGRVFGPDGITPVGLADVELQIGNRIVGVAVTSDADEDRGSFRFEHVPASSYRVEVFDNRSGRAGASGGTITTQGQTTYTQVRMVPTGTVTGVVSLNGSPSVHASVTIQAGESGLNSTRLTATTDSEGGFIFSGIPEGAIRLTATAAGGLTGATDATLVGPPGQPLSTVANIELTPSVTVEGVVRAHGSTAPVPGARVTLRVVNRNFTTTTIADGSYRIPFVPLGSMVVWTNAPVGYDRGEAAPVVADTPGATHVVNLEMNGVGSVEGVARTNTGAIVTVGTVKLVNDVWANSGRSQSVSISVPVRPDGSFRVDNAPAGDMSLRLTVPGDARVGAANGAITATQMATLDVALESAGSVTGTVVLPDSAGPATGSDVTVRLARAGKPTLNFYTHSNSQGVFQVNNVPLGAVTVSIEDASTGGIASGSGQLTANGETVNVGTLTLDDDLIHVVSIDPVNGSTNVPRDKVIRITFSEPALPSSVGWATVNIVSTDGVENSTVTLSADGLSATLAPSANFTWKDFKLYTVHVSTGVKDLAQRPMASTFMSTFSTIDTTPPYAWLPSPRDGATGMPANLIVELWYNEPLAADQNLAQVVRLAPQSDPTAYVAATVIQRPGEGQKLLLTPSQPLAEFTTYVLTANGARDLYGLLQVAPWSSTFRTKDVTPPVIDPLPIDGTTVTSARPTITATFSDVPSGVAINSGTVTIDGQNVSTSSTSTTLSATPDWNLTAGTHTVSISVRDVDQNTTSRTASFTVANSLPSISSFMIAGQPAVDGMTVAHTLSPAYSATYSAVSGINQGQTKLLIGQGSNTPAPVSAIVGPSTLTYQTPGSLAVGDYTAELVVKDNLGNTVSSGPIHFSINPEAPVLQTVSPNQGSQHGGTTVTLTGPRLLGLTGTLPTVSVSGFAAQVLSGTAGSVDQVTVVMPPGAPGLASIRIASNRGSGLFADTYTYTEGTGTPFAVEADTRLLWHLDEGANNAPQAIDAGPLSIDGVIANTVGGGAVDGRFGKARLVPNVQGDDDLGQLAFGSGSFTVEGWIKTGPLAAGSAFLLMGRSHGIVTTTAEEYGIHLDAGGNLTAVIYPATGSAVQAVMPGAAFDVDDDAWHAVTMVVNRETAKLELYVDGVMRKDADIPASFGSVKSVSGYRFRLGYRSNTTSANAFSGTIDEVRVSSTAHTAEQIAATLSGNGAPVVTRVSPNRFVQRGGTSEIVVDGYGFSNASVTATGPGGVALEVQVQARSATTLRLLVSASSAVALGNGQLTVTSTSGSAVTSLSVVDQAPFAVEPDTRLLWHLDDVANGPTQAIDAGPLSIDGYLPTGSVPVTGRFGKARSGVYVKGDDDYGQLAFGSTSFTVEGWIKTGPLTAGSSYLLMGRGHDTPSGTAQEYGIHLDGTGNLTALIYPATGSVVQAVMPATAFDVDDNAWHAVAMVVNRETGKLELYVDGLMRKDADIPTGFGAVKSVSGYRFRSGDRSSSTGGFYFPGTVDEVRVSSTARSAAQIAESVNGTGSPVITRVAPTRFVPRGGTSELVVEGYGFSNAAVTAAGPAGEPLDVQVVTQSSTRLQLQVSAGNAVALGEGQLTVTSADGSGNTPLTVVDQSRFAVEGDTRLLWHLDETATGPTQAVDAGPLYINGYIPSGSAAVNGRFGKARAGSYVQGDDDLGQLAFGSGSFTVEGWIKTTPLVAGSSYQLMGRTYAIPNGTAQEYGVHLDGAGNLTALIYPATGPVVQAVMPATAFDVDDGAWHAVAMVVNRETGKLELYVDGVMRKDADIPAGFGAVKVVSSFRFRMGDRSSSTGPNYFPGSIDEVRVSSSAHSAAQILASAQGTTTPTVVRALPYAIAQRGVGPVPLTLTGYGLLGLSVTAGQPDVVVDVVSSTADRCDLSINVPTSTPLGPMQLTLTDAHGHSSTTTIDVVEQKAFVNNNQTSAETGLLWHLDETGAGNVVIYGTGDPMPLVLGGTASTGSVATAGRFAPAGAPSNTGARSNLSITADSDSGNLAFGAGSFTVETWMKSGPLPAGTKYQLVGRSTTNPSTSTQEYSILLDAKGKLIAQIYQTNTVFVQAAMSPYDLGVDDNVWHYVAMVVNRTTGKLELYVDGALRAETAIPGTFGSIRTISGSRVQVGFKADSGAAFPGAIDEVRILRYAAPATQIRDTWLGVSTAGKYAFAGPSPGSAPEPPPPGDSATAVAHRAPDPRTYARRSGGAK